MNKTARAWCFTSFKSLETIRTHLDGVDKNSYKYIIFQEEKSPTTDKLHLQGYLELNTPSRFTAVKKLLNDDALHVEARKGTADEARAYASKEETRVSGPYEYGTWTKQGERSDLKRVRELIKDGASPKDLFEEEPEAAFKYQRGIEACRAAYAKQRDKNIAPTIQIIWGPSGTGKTRQATEENPDAYILSKPREGKGVWWDGYYGQSTVIIDEFYGWIPYDLFLRVLDRYPLRVEFKGGSTELSATKFVITSNKPWEEWYPNIDNTDALKRRIREFGTITHKLALENNDGQLHFV